MINQLCPCEKDQKKVKLIISLTLISLRLRELQLSSEIRAYLDSLFFEISTLVTHRCWYMPCDPADILPLAIVQASAYFSQNDMSLSLARYGGSVFFWTSIGLCGHLATRSWPKRGNVGGKSCLWLADVFFFFIRQTHCKREMCGRSTSQRPAYVLENSYIRQAT